MISIGYDWFAGTYLNKGAQVRRENREGFLGIPNNISYLGVTVWAYIAKYIIGGLGNSFFGNFLTKILGLDRAQPYLLYMHYNVHK